MKTNMKKIFITLGTTLGALVIVTTSVYAIGTLTPSGTAGDDTQYTLNDIYNKITADTNAVVGSGTISVPENQTATFHTLTEIYNALPDWQTLSNNTTVVAEGFYEATDLVTVDSDLSAENIADGVTIFGVTGTLEQATTLEWSTNQGSMNWASAVSTCAGTVDGSTGWRLPTVGELTFETEKGPAQGIYDNLEQNKHHWSSTTYSPGDVFIVSWSGYLDLYATADSGSNYTVCVK